MLFEQLILFYKL